MDNPSFQEPSTSGLQTAKVHYSAIKTFLEAYLAKEQAGVSPARQSAREKLTRLFPHQFEELSTDVYDEMNRRISDESIPFLPVQPDFHPKRNQARQKLATLSSSRFKDLASDVYHELERRYPTLKNSTDQLEAIFDEDLAKPVATLQKGDEEKPSVVNAPSSNNEKDPFGVNFQTLDNLMADLGSMIATSLDEPKTEPNVNRIKEQTTVEESRMSRTANLSQTNNTTGGSVTLPSGPTTVQSVNITSDANQKYALDQKIEKERLQSDNAALAAEIERLRGDLSRFESTLKDTKKEYDLLSNEKEHIVRESSEHIAILRNEVKSLKRELADANPEQYLKEIKSLTAALNDTEAERDTLRTMVQALEMDKSALQEQLVKEQNSISVLRSELSSLKNEIEVFKTSSLRATINSTEVSPDTKPSPMPPVETKQDMLEKLRFNEPHHHSDQGYMHKQQLDDFRSAISELLRASKFDTPAAVLIAMKSIVVATRSISDGIERFEKSSNSSTQVEQTQTIRSDVSNHLTNLMTATKNHATGNTGADKIEVYANDLVDDIVNIVKVLRISKPLSMAKLKTFLEQQTDLIVQNIQVLLQEMRQPAFGAEFRQTIGNITTVVDNLIQVSKTSIQEKSLKDSSGGIIENLSNSNSKLAEMGDGMLSDKKPSKQKLAAAAYEVAKYTKELVSLFNLDSN